MSCLVRARACPQIAFCKLGRQIVGMNWGTRSSARQKFGGDVGASTGTFNGAMVRMAQE